MATNYSSSIHDSDASGTHSRHGSTISVLSVPIMDPYYRDLQALKADHAALYNQLKLTQQTLQLSYQDQVIAQERSKRSGTDSTRLRAHLDTILKKHVEHHPEREALVQQVAELQVKLDIELGSRQVLEQEHINVQQELLRYKLNSAVAKSSLGSPSTEATPRSPSPTASIRSLTFSSLLGGATRRYRNSLSNGSQSACGAAAMNANGIHSQEILQQHQQQQLQQQKEALVSSSPQRLAGQCSYAATDLDVQMAQDLDHESLAALQLQLPMCEQLEAEKVLYEKLREENIAMKMELLDLRHRNNVEKDSIKGYMSLYESLQKKQSNALAVSESEIDLLRNALQGHILRLESRESLIRTFAATVNSQAVDLEILTKEASRERTARARCEQEMASLLEASLLMLERWHSNVVQTFARLQEVVRPVRQTIQHLEIPSILQEWDQYEKGMQKVLADLAHSLVVQQQNQERELTLVADHEAEGLFTDVNAQSRTFNTVRVQRNRGSTENSQTAAAATALSYANSSDSKDDGIGISGLENAQVFQDSYSQQVFVWRKFKADSFLEECVKSVEKLAHEKRELQMRVAELTRAVTELDEDRCLRKLTPRSAGVVVSEERDSSSEDIGSKEGVDPEETAVVTKEETAIVTKEETQREALGNAPPRIDIPLLTEARPNDEENSTEGSGLAEEKGDHPAFETMDNKVNSEVPGDSRKQQLESIMKQILEWSESQTAKKRSHLRGAEDAIESLGISDSLSIPAATRSTVARAEAAQTEERPRVSSLLSSGGQEDLETFIQMIRQAVEHKSTDHAASVEAEEGQRPETVSSLKIAENESFSTNRKFKSHPGPITTLPSCPTFIAPAVCSSSSTTTTPRSSCSFSVSSTSTASFTSSSSYFPYTASLGGVSTPSSPGLGGFGGSDGKTVLDMDALCRDLAFRSFPKQHQWSKSRSLGQKEKRAHAMQLKWVASSLSVSKANASALLPPLPPPVPTLSRSQKRSE
ncbi:hypothetical protein KVV02_005767 [Mortierella alpina]|uniref:Uncharacterized protein n=1 Tax=Mortierella alpina TaxID=64518 RepID=A0A9P8A7W2_MORAP|nr:hypothetical protein KVV02_005767 [Mortierella alpina]